VVDSFIVGSYELLQPTTCLVVDSFMVGSYELLQPIA